MTVTLDNQTIAWTDAYLKNGDAIGITAGIVETNPLTTGDITANVSGFYASRPHRRQSDDVRFPHGNAADRREARCVIRLVLARSPSWDGDGHPRNVGIGTKTICGIRSRCMWRTSATRDTRR
ncbi:MAG: hypothetical protein IPI01_19480 [Ignavibacteriae bacterium]|nr:hypothetical protein [Ignavibacteriota bacterium]